MTTLLGVRTRWPPLKGSYIEHPNQAYHLHFIWVAAVTTQLLRPIIFTGIFFTTSFHLDLLTFTSTSQRHLHSDLTSTSQRHIHSVFSTFYISVSFINNIDMMITLSHMCIDIFIPNHIYICIWI